MTEEPASPRSKLTFFLDAKLHENLKIRLYYDQIKTQSEFFRFCVESYLNQDALFMEFLDHYKTHNEVQSKARVTKSRKLRKSGSRMLEDLALTDVDIENIFDIIEEELPEL
jgi:hypothetical protein